MKRAIMLVNLDLSLVIFCYGLENPYKSPDKGIWFDNFAYPVIAKI